MTSSVIITIVVVLGIVVAGGFLLYFVGDLLMSLSNKGKEKDNEAIKNAQLKSQQELENRVKALEDNQNKENSSATILYNGAVVEAYNPDEEEKEKEEVEEVSQEETEPMQEETQEEATEESAQEEESEEEEDDEASEYIRQRRAQLMERLAKMQQQEQEIEEEESVDISEEEQETEETPVEEVAEETTVEETSEEETPAEEVPAQEEVVTEETTEEESAEEQNQEEVQEETPVIPVVPVEVDEKFASAKASEDENALASTMTLEELEAKLAEEQEKLKANEKELRQCKKEFLPLRKVKKTLENDEKKLRRKEALVAKQKVMLYGVNNYADIDEEKAKKLAEDLDLYDGLKLSVQHCEEVMAKNKERYPLLEKIYDLLTSQNAEIKEDIKKLQEAIAQLKTADDSTDSTDAE